MQINKTNAFARSARRLHKNQAVSLERCIEKIRIDPTIGESKKGDCLGVRVYKIHMLDQLTLLAYTYNEAKKEIILLDVGSHENFYRNLKNSCNIILNVNCF